MPSLNPCPKCDRADFVRFERVITGIRVSRLYYCGSCDHEWHAGDAPLRSTNPPLPKARTRTIRPKSRKS